MEFPFSDIFLQVGDEFRDLQLRADTFCPPHRIKDVSVDAELLVLVYWLGSSNDWLDVKVFGQDTSGRILPVSDAKQVEMLLRLANIQLNARHRHALLRMKRSAELVLDFTIHTDSKAFHEAVPPIPAPTSARTVSPPATIIREIGVVTAIREHRLLFEDKVRLKFSPVSLPPFYRGIVALDFGNASTTVARLDPAHFEVAQIELIDVRQKVPTSSSPIPTVLRVTSVSEPPEPANQPADVRRADLAAFTAFIGEDAMQGVSANQHRRTIFGAKRMLADIPGDQGFQLQTDNGSILCRRRLLAELFLTELLRGFVKRTKTRPEKLVITCPTTFSPREQRNLKEAAARAMCRVLNEDIAKLSDRQVDRYIANVIDEATAAAFYFMYRDFIAADGGAPALRYNHGNGIHALLIDCGGGTTDIALVKASPQTGQSVSLAVLGRAGHRTFGGDYITKQLFRLLKAKIFANERFTKAADVDLIRPTDGDWKGFIERYREPLATLLPTSFDRHRAWDTENDRRRDATYYLWTLAEAFKRTLSADSLVDPQSNVRDQRLKVDDKFDVRIDHVLSYCQLSADVVSKVAQLLDVSVELLNDIAVRRSDLNQLIYDETKRTIDYANHLVDRLRRQAASEDGRGCAVPPTIEKVYLVGNASQYPFIRQMLVDPTNGLHVPFLVDNSGSDGGGKPRSSTRQVLVNVLAFNDMGAEPRRGRGVGFIAPDDMKGAVVKGAVLAQKVRVRGLNVAVAWDHDLINKLPFDIIHVGPGYVEGFLRIFREGTRYDACIEGKLEQPVDPRTKVPSVVDIALHKLWPGDGVDDASLFATFNFAEPVAGTLSCKYGDQERYWVEPTGGRPVVATPPTEPDPLGPVQSGDL